MKHGSLENERHRIVRTLAGQLEHEPGIVFAYLFGSCAGLRPFRDIDVGVFLRSPSRQSKSALELSQRLSSALRLPVDVRPLNNAPTSFLYHVLRGELLVSNDDDFLSSLIESTARHYLDIAPLRRRATREAFS